MNKILNAIGIIVSLFLCLILFVVLVFYLCFYLTPKIVTKDNVSILVSELDIKEILGKEDYSVFDSLYEVAELNNIDKTVVDDIINSKEIKTLLGNHFGSLVDAFLYEKEPQNITANELLNSIGDILDRKSNELGYNLTIEQKNIILGVVEVNIDELVKIIPTYEDLTQDLVEEDKKNIQFIFGGGVSSILLFILVILVIAIILCRFSIYRFAIWTGVTTSLVGIIFTIIGEALKSMMPQMLNEIYSVNIITMIQNDIVNIITKTGFTVLIIGAVQIIYYFIIRKTKEYKKLY